MLIHPKREGKSYFPAKKISKCSKNRIGYQSSGGFAIESLTSLPDYQAKSIAPAYKVHVKAFKLDGKDGPLGLGKSGNKILAGIFF